MGWNQLQGDLRMLVAELRQFRHQQMARYDFRQGQPHRTLETLVQPQQVALEIFDLAGDPLSMCHHRQAMLVELQTRRGAIEQHDSQTLLELIQTPRNRRVMLAQHHGRTPHRTLDGDGQYHLQIIPVEPVHLASGGRLRFLVHFRIAQVQKRELHFRLAEVFCYRK